MKLREMIESKVKILIEKAKDGSMTFYAKFTEVEKFNKNKRFYSKKIMTREIDRVQAKIASGQFLGQADHGDTPATFLQNVSHIVTKLEMIGNDGFATVKILNTDSGQNIQKIIRGGGRIGLSTKSVGTVDSNGHINDDLRLLSLDLVVDPSVRDATFSKENILEGVEFEEEQDDSIADREEALFDLLKTSYDKAINDNMWYGDFESYKALHEKGLRATLLLPEKDGKPLVQKLTEQQIKDRVQGYYIEAVKGGFKGTFEEWKEKYPRLVEMASEPTKVAKAPEPEEPFVAKITWAEAVAAGFEGTIAEYREKYPDIELILPTPPQKKIVETLEQEAQRIFEALKKDNPNSDIKLATVKRMLEKEELAKEDKRIIRKAIAIISRECDGSVSPEKLEKMVEQEVKNLKKERQEMRERNWQAYKRLLD